MTASLARPEPPLGARGEPCACTTTLPLPARAGPERGADKNDSNDIQEEQNVGLLTELGGIGLIQAPAQQDGLVAAPGVGGKESNRHGQIATPPHTYTHYSCPTH